jgi:hypothetical protein
MGSTRTRGSSRTTSAPFTALHPPRLKRSMGRSPGSGQCGCSICIETTRRDQMRGALDVVAGQTPFRAQLRSWTVRRQPDPSRCSAPRGSSVSACVNRLRMTHTDTGARSNQYRVNTRPGRIFQGTRRQYSSQATSYCTMWRRLALGAKQDGTKHGECRCCAACCPKPGVGGRCPCLAAEQQHQYAGRELTPALAVLRSCSSTRPRGGEVFSAGGASARPAMR